MYHLVYFYLTVVCTTPDTRASQPQHPWQKSKPTAAQKSKLTAAPMVKERANCSTYGTNTRASQPQHPWQKSKPTAAQKSKLTAAPMVRGFRDILG